MNSVRIQSVFQNITESSSLSALTTRIDRGCFMFLFLSTAYVVSIDEVEAKRFGNEGKCTWIETWCIIQAK